MLALSVRGETHGLLAVAGESRIPRALQSSLAALATEVSLALESAALTEEVHRRTSEARFGSLVQHASDLITVLDATGLVVYQSPSIERVLGYTPEELVGTRFERAAGARRGGPPARTSWPTRRRTPPGTEALECSLRHKDGGVRQFEVLYTDLLDDENVHGVVLNSRDVSERKVFEEQLAHQAFHDPVTNLANRALFVERVRHAVPRARREGARLAVIFMDLDDFKTINDSLGHAAGDAVLLEVAKRLDAQHPPQRHRGPLRRRRVRRPARGRRAARRPPPTPPSGSSRRSPRRCGSRARSCSSAAASASRSPRATPPPAPTS